MRGARAHDPDGHERGGGAAGGLRGGGRPGPYPEAGAVPQLVPKRHQTHHHDRPAEIPCWGSHTLQVHVPVVQKVQKTVEVPQVQYEDQVVQVPVQTQAGLSGRAQAVARRIEAHGLNPGPKP